MNIAGPRVRGFERLEPRTLYDLNGGCVICGLSEGAMEEHHTIPQIAGGLNSPRVLLCSSCHDGIHDAVVKRINPDEYSRLPDAKQRWSGKYQLTWAVWLMNHIVKGDATTKTDPNRLVSMKLRLNRHEDGIVMHVQRILRCNKEEAVRHIVSNFNVASLNRPVQS